MFTFLRSVKYGSGYWKAAPFAELFELYSSRFLRMVSHGMVGVFATVFLYQKGYSLPTILAYIGWYYVIRMVASFFSAYYVAWAGPKQATLVSNVLAVPSFLALGAIDTYTELSVWVYFVCTALSLSLYVVASDMQFSSLNNPYNVGKQIGWLHIAEKIGIGIAPAVGGFVAYLFGPESTMWIAAVLAIVASLPLFMTPEQIHKRQKVIFHGIPLRRIGVQLLSNSASGVDQVVSGAVWAIFIAVVVFGTQTDRVYAELGAVLSVSLIVSVVSSYFYGRVIDRRRGAELFRAGGIVNATLHGLRAFVATPLSVVLVNVLNEIGTSAYQMPYVRGMYDEADNLPGYRAAYISLMMVTFCAGAALFAFAASGLVVWLGPRQGLAASFGLAAACTVIMLWHGFASLRPSE